MDHKLSVVIITLNEEENIGRCIDSVKEIADETVVVDSFSKDNTKAIATAKGARVMERAFTNYIDQKNFAQAQAANDYVLNIDADECLSTELLQNIMAEKQRGFAADAYSMNRLNFYCGKPVKTCGWYPDKKLRLWNRQKVCWTGGVIHEKPNVPAESRILHLPGDLLHYSFPTKESLIMQCDKFAAMAALQLKSKGRAYLIYKLVLSAPFKFIRNYFFKLGFTDGLAGFTICYNQGREVFLKYYRALKLKNK